MGVFVLLWVLDNGSSGLWFVPPMPLVRMVHVTGSYVAQVNTDEHGNKEMGDFGAFSAGGKLGAVIGDGLSVELQSVA
ncbi:hypothetical protein [Mycobacterium uberis]|uniref:hypothetical protein n=1 Tax=Mycobacterium uberis TaxID=2162698 RepID=UPI001403FCAB|nr:hypothetical protein [Mycobacterium uberis]